MDNKTFMRVLEGTHKRLLDLTRTKGEEYKTGSDDQLANFKRVAERTGVRSLTALLTFMNKHYDSLCDYARREQLGMDKIESEPIYGRIDDLIMYAILYKAMVMEQDGVGSPESSGHGTVSVIRNPYADDPIRAIGSKGGVVEREPPCNTPTQPESAAAESVPQTAAPSWKDMQASVVEWASSAFPNRNIDTVRLKLMMNELPELMTDIGLRDWKNIGEEMADVMILLLDLASMLHIDLQAETFRKLEINRGRKWLIGKDGVSQHYNVLHTGHGHD